MLAKLYPEQFSALYRVSNFVYLFIVQVNHKTLPVCLPACLHAWLPSFLPGKGGRRDEEGEGKGGRKEEEGGRGGGRKSNGGIAM